ncbi:PfkB family carbohydrate kinase [Kineococcus sp. SYSU DK001]|uniref:PfkB family carbohydrate kinase n=1 Tax=Kineococcus sp. SYSU DK001 TaxID=3383122 RepID=UPI003D7EA891
MRILGYGDNFVDKFVDRRTYYPGGNAVNVAVFAAALGAEAAYLGVFGDDDLATHVRRVLADLSIDTTLSVTRPGETGWAEVEVVDGDRVFRGWNGGGVTTADPLLLGEAEIAHAAGFDLVHSGVYGGTAGEVHKLAAAGPLLSFDFSEEPEFRTAEFLRELCPSLDLALFSGGEDSGDDLVQTLRDAVAAGTRLALGTRGAAGSVAWDGRTLHEQAAVLTDHPVDTMGCGDSFLAAFAVHALSSGWKRGNDLPSAVVRDGLRTAAEFSGRQTLTEGAFGYGRSY